MDPRFVDHDPRRDSLAQDIDLKERKGNTHEFIVDVPLENDPGGIILSDRFSKIEKREKPRKPCCSGSFLESVWYNVVVICALIAWAALILIEYFLFDELETYELYLRLLLHVFFVMELILRILLSNCTEEYIAGNIKWYVFDSILLACAIAIDVALFFPGTIPLRETLITQFVVYFVRIAIRMYIGYIGLTKGARRLVGGRKRRFIGGGFDLDLTYIEPQLIAMGLPSVNYEGLYRNPLREVVRFFNTRHKTQYRIYNLCDERDYPEEGFQGAVRRFGFDDHNPPPLSLLVRLCTEASDFINEASGHVVAIHCKGGKGRTGVVTAAMLLKMHRDWYAEKALLKFAVMRTDDDVSANKRVGVDGPSQRRYVEYWEKIRNIEPKTCLEKLSLSAPKTKFERLSLFNINVSHNFLAGQALKALKSDNKFDDSSLLGWTLSVKNYWYNPKLGKEDIKTYVFEAQASRRSATDLRRDGVSFNIKSWEQKSQTLSLSGDVRFQVFPLNVREYPDAKPFCEFWVHTSFLSRSGQLTLRKADLDHVFRNSKIDKDFNIQLTYKAGQRTWDFDRSPAVSEVNHRHASHRSGHSSKVSRTTSQTSPRRPKPPQERKLFDIS